MTDAAAAAYIAQAQGSLTSALAELAPTPPPPAGTVWDRVDAPSASVDPNNATLIAPFQKFAVPANGGPYFTAAVAENLAHDTDPLYAVPILAETVPPLSARIPLGTQPGCTADRSLYVIQPDGSVADLSGAAYNANTRHIVSAQGGAIVPKGAVNETGPGSANAAAFPLAAGPLTPDDLAAFATTGAVRHPLVFSCPNLGPAPNRYPARKGSAGYPGGTGIVLGTRLRLRPGTAPIAGASLIGRCVTAYLLEAGMYCRDINPAPYGTLSIIGLDAVNAGGNATVWPGVGVPLPIKTAAGVPYAVGIGPAVPWAALEVLSVPQP